MACLLRPAPCCDSLRISIWISNRFRGDVIRIFRWPQIHQQSGARRCREKPVEPPPPRSPRHAPLRREAKRARRAARAAKRGAHNEMPLIASSDSNSCLGLWPVLGQAFGEKALNQLQYDEIRSYNTQYDEISVNAPNSIFLVISKKL